MKKIRVSRLFVGIILVAFIIRIFAMMWSFQYRENTDVLRYRD